MILPSSNQGFQFLILSFGFKKVEVTSFSGLLFDIPFNLYFFRLEWIANQRDLLLIVGRTQLTNL
ncbi:hypothetical protein BDE02_05G087200 [Populus trichocarpa]|nr:hypothetical protein BDE02_05G087200 [Populus trichocarpa]